MVISIDPSLRARLIAVDGADVVGLRVIVPCDDLYEVKDVTVGDDVLPTSVVQV